LAVADAIFSNAQALALASVLGAGLAVCLVGFSEGALALMGAGPKTGQVHQLASEFLVIRWAPGRSPFKRQC
jgi:Na+-driven multidrug efflux pump